MDLIKENGGNLKEKKVRKNLIQIQNTSTNSSGDTTNTIIETDIGIGSANPKITILLPMA